MAYASVNFRTKKALKDAVKTGQHVGVWQPGPFGPNVEPGGIAYLEGPWYPEAHRWYARVRVANGQVVRVE